MSLFSLSSIHKNNHIVIFGSSFSLIIHQQVLLDLYSKYPQHQFISVSFSLSLSLLIFPPRSEHLSSLVGLHPIASHLHLWPEVASQPTLF
jgi:hypothetical protein